MPGSVVRKVTIVATADSLLLLPSLQRNLRSVGGIKIPWGTNQVQPKGDEVKIEGDGSCSSVESHGVVGILTVGPSSYLISISNRKQAAVIFGKPVYVITDVALIPLSSQSDASKVIEQTKAALKKGPTTAHKGDEVTGNHTSDDEEYHPVHTKTTEDDDLTGAVTPDSRDGQPHESQEAKEADSSVAVDVIGRQGQYGRFAERWFSKKGWAVDKRRNLGLSTDVAGKEPIASLDQSGPAKSKEETEKQGGDEQLQISKTADLLPKMLRTTKMLLSSESFFFSYEYDITRRLGDHTKGADLPLYKVVDPLFFWNRHLASQLIAANQHSFVLPLMQGFVGQRAFTVNTESNDPSRTIAAVTENVGQIELDEKIPKATDLTSKTRDFLITLVSRRSIERPGLRFMRRGINERGHTANSVETEQILSDPSWSANTQIYSYVGIRGSIPLYFSQSPYSLKPVPVLQHSFDTNHAAFQRHFKNLFTRYGEIQIVVLVDKKGGEADIGAEYEKHTNQLNSENGIQGSKLGFEWFDFHNICRGMKFENVGILLDNIGSKLDEFGYTVVLDGKIQRKQSGVLRTNCMDCLDRTNVVQSACGQRAVEQQLKAEGINVDMQKDRSSQWFNTLWADNGDAISKQYASTQALKGDYVRTRRRNYQGVLVDWGLSLERFYSGLLVDFFSQAAIDYLLGNVTDQVFEDFEANMMSADPAVSMQTMRQSAIEQSQKVAIADENEELVGAWSLSCPHEANTVRTFPFEEAVLLVTNAAVYAVRFDWNIDKVSSFERVDLRSIVGIIVGVYITSTLAATHTDELKNYGLVIKYKPGKEDMQRVNTRSLSTAPQKEERSKQELESADKDQKVQKDKPSSSKSPPSDLKILAFKALPARSSFASANQGGEEAQTLSERELVAHVFEEIRKTVGVEKEGFVEEKDIISLAEAKKKTGLLEQGLFYVKKALWA